MCSWQVYIGNLNEIIGSGGNGGNRAAADSGGMTATANSGGGVGPVKKRTFDEMSEVVHCKLEAENKALSYGQAVAISAVNYYGVEAGGILSGKAQGDLNKLEKILYEVSGGNVEDGLGHTDHLMTNEQYKGMDIMMHDAHSFVISYSCD